MINKILLFWNHSIKRQLILGISFLILTSLLLTSLNIFKNQSNFLLHTSIEDAKSRTTLLANNAVIWVLSNDFIGLQEVVDALNIYENEKYTMIIDVNGEVLAHSDKSKVGKYLSDKVSLEHLKSKTLKAQILYHSMNETNHFIEVASPIQYKGQLLGYARTAIDHNAEMHSLNIIKQNTLIYASFAIIFAILFAYFGAEGLTKSLYRLIDTTKKIKKGGRNIRAEVSGVQEIKTLALEFNSMLQSKEEIEQTLEKAKKEIFEEEQKLETIIETIPDLLWMKDIYGVYLVCNKRFEDFFGAKQKEIIGKTDYDFVPKELADSFGEHDKDAMNSYIPLTNEEEITFASDGHTEYLQTTKTSVRDADGNILGVLGIGRDISELKKAEDMMIAQSRNAAMGEMMSMIAHQWRQPISTIAMEANNILIDIELDLLNNDSLRELASNIVKQTQELSKTIDDFRDFFKPQKNLEEVFVKDVVQSVLEVINASLQNNQVTLILNMDENIKIRTYSRELMQVLINILKNAKEILIEKEITDKKIVMTFTKEKEALHIEICDNGGGVDEAIIDKIFNPYFTTKDAKNGTGLGLYISQTIIEKHLHGTIDVNNNSEGACFHIKLPFDILVNGESCE